MILVTGGAGFIGSCLVSGLIKNRLGPVAVCDRLNAEGQHRDKWKNLAKSPLVALVPPDEIFSWLDAHKGKVECIFHMGACSSTTEEDTDYLLANNFGLTMDLWDWCTTHKSRLIYASSAATYGNGQQGFDDDEKLYSLCALRPLNPYGWSKCLSDMECVRRASAGMVPPQWAGLKFFNVYGPNEYHKGAQRSVVHQIFESVRDNGQATLFRSHNPDYEDGGQMRDFVWVKDCVHRMLWLYCNPGVSGIFNCGSGKARSFYDLARAVFNAMGQKVKIDWRDTPLNIQKHYQYFTEANMQKFYKAGYSAQATSLEMGVEAYVKNYLLTDDPYC